LTQYNNVPNAYGGVLDFVLTGLSSDAVNIVRDVMPLVPIDLYHPPLEINILIPFADKSGLSEKNVDVQVNTPAWNFRKADFIALYGSIAAIDWADVFGETDVNLAVEAFYQKLNAAIDLTVPLKKPPASKNRYVYPSWYTPELIHCIQLKYHHLKMYKSCRSHMNHEAYKYFRTHVKGLIDRDYSQYLNGVEHGIVRDPAKFWDFVRSKKNRSNQQPEYKYKGKVVMGQEAADAFAEYFGSVFHSNIPKLDPEQAEQHARNTSGCNASLRVEIPHITLAELRKAATRLKASSSCGPDNIPPYLAKDCLTILEAPLLYIYNLALKLNIYPAKWKVSRVTPIPKEANSVDVATYRPIAILPVFGKLFEGVLNSCLIKQIGNNLHDAQHGFRSGRSTATNHICFFDYVLKYMDSHRQVDAIYFDFKKAFDLVDNDVLLQKLCSLGFTTKLVSFFASYLGDRRQYVQMSSFRSSDYFTRSGVSQGSNLGPTQFLIMVDDLCRGVTGAQSLLFADDLKLMLPINDAVDCGSLQRVIDYVSQWSASNKLELNALKCKTITFSRSNNPFVANYHLSGTPLCRVSTIQDLGITLDTRLEMRDHIVNICKKANKMLGFIIRTASLFNNVKVAILLYNAYVRSRLEYNSIVWDPREKKYTLLIERVQRKFARFLYKRYYGYYPTLFPSLFVTGMVGLETLHVRRKISTLTHYCLLLRHKVDNPSVLAQLNLFVPDNFTKAVGRKGRQARNLFTFTSKTRTLQACNAPTARATALLNEFLAQIQDADVFADSWSSLRLKIIRFANSLTFL
jgi:hypothetical protein